MNLVNAQEMQKIYPGKFEAPSQEDLSKLKTGDFVKLCFEDKERMWVKILLVSDDTITGILDSNPTMVNLKAGDKVKFKREHVYEIGDFT